MRNKTLTIVMAVIMVLTMIAPALAHPPYPEGDEPSITVQPEDIGLPYAARPSRPAKPIDQPNRKDYLRIQERQRLLEAGETALASSLVLSGTDRILVILVEFAGTDVFTWTAPITPTDPTTGSQWDPLGIADPNEFTGDIGDCSLIITETTTFTYTGPLHNMMERPRSLDDRSGDTIWTDDFEPQWFEDFMLNNGVVISYTMQDSTPIYESFIGQSVRDYFSDLSSGVYTITGDVVGWLGVPHSTWYYDADECPGSRSGARTSRGAIPGAGSSRTLVQDALDAVNAISNTIPGFDWANYDLDGDGVVDRMWIVHAGYGEEDSTTLLNRDPVTGTQRTTPYPAAFYGESAVWSHSASVTPPYSVTQDIAVGPYIIMPENGGIGVFAHEYAHNLGAWDLYAYGEGETSAGFWALQADDWTGYPIGFEPPAPDPMHLDMWGWLDPAVITDTSKVYTVTLGQASYFPGGADVYRGAKIPLADGVTELPVPVWQGDYYWWGGKKDESNARMITKDPINLTGATTYTLSFDLVYDIEDEWDFLWVQVSEDGVTWNYTDTLTNENTQCIHDPAWIGELYGFPDDLCGAGIGGFYGYNANWPDPETQVFDLSAYAGKSIYLRFWFMTDWATTYSGAFVDNVEVTADTTTLFEDDAESGDAKWDYEAPWMRTDGLISFKHYYYLQWRNVNDNGGYDSALGETRWRFGPANTGLLMWYNNTYYTDNEVWSYLFDDPSLGPKGNTLVIDSHPEPYRDPHWVAYGFDNEGGNVTHRSQMRDAPFTLQDTVPFTMTDPYVYTTTQFTGRPAVSTFNDALGYYPGAEFVNRGPAYPPTQFKWVTKQWDASAVVPSKSFYPLYAPGYDGTVTADEAEFRFNCSAYTSGPYAGYLGCYWFGNDTGLGYKGGYGNPGETNGQYGWVVELIEEAADHTWGKVRVYNQQVGFASTVDKSEITMKAPGTYTVTYQTVVENAGTTIANNVVVTYTLDADLTATSLTSTGGTSDLATTSWSVAALAPDAIITVTLVATGTADLPLADDTLTTQVDAYDGQIARGPWSFDTDVVVPTVGFSTPTDGQVFRFIVTTSVPVEVTTTDFDIPTDGHWHLWVDGVDMGQVLTYTTATTLTLGTHVISAELRLTDDTVLGPVAKVSVTVEPYTIFLPVVMRNY